MEKRKYLPTLAELIDRLSISQLKEVFIPEHKEEYAQEIRDIEHDIDLILKEDNGVIDAKTVRSIVVLAQTNLHIWHNESNYRKGIKEGNNLDLIVSNKRLDVWLEEILLRRNRPNYIFLKLPYYF